MTQTEWKLAFKDNLAYILGERGMTQAELARDAGMSASRISEYLSGRSIPTVVAAVNMAYALDVDVNELIDFDERIV